MLDMSQARGSDGFAVDAPAIPSDERVSARTWYAVCVLAMVNCFANMDRIGLSILLELIKRDLHLTDAQLGIVSGFAFAVFYVLLGLPLAWIADHYSRVKLLSVCLALWSAMTAVTGMAQSYSQLFAARMGVGVGEAGSHPPAHSLIGQYFPRQKRALGIGVFNAGAALGGAGGLALIGILGEQLGWRTALQIVGAMGIPLALLVYFTLPEPARPVLPRESKDSALQNIGALLRRRAYVHLVLAFSIAHVGTQGFSVWSPAFLMRSFGMRMGEVGAWLGGITAAFAITGTLLGGYLTSRLLSRDARWELWLPMSMTALCVPVFAAMAFSPTAGVALGLKALNTLFGGMGTGVAIAAVQSFAEPRQRATAVAITLLVSALLGTGAGPYVIGAASTALEPTFGTESLRYALLATPVMLVWAVIHYALAARDALRDRVN